MPSGRNPPRRLLLPHAAPVILLLVFVDAVQAGRPHNERHLRPVRRPRPLPFLRRRGALVDVRERLSQVRILSRAIGEESAAAATAPTVAVLVGRRRRRRGGWGVVVVNRRGGRRAAAVRGVRSLRPQDVRVRASTTTGGGERRRRRVGGGRIVGFSGKERRRRRPAAAAVVRGEP